MVANWAMKPMRTARGMRPMRRKSSTLRVRPIPSITTPRTLTVMVGLLSGSHALGIQSA